MVRGQLCVLLRRISTCVWCPVRRFSVLKEFLFVLFSSFFVATILFGSKEIAGSAYVFERNLPVFALGL